MTDFYYEMEGNIIGPITGIELREAALRGRVSPSTRVSTQPNGEWVPANRVRNLFDEVGLPTPHPPETQEYLASIVENRLRRALDESLHKSIADASSPSQLQWFWRFGSRQIGPLTEQQLVELLKSSSVQPNEELRYGEHGPWIEASRIGRFINGNVSIATSENANPDSYREFASSDIAPAFSQSDSPNRTPVVVDSSTIASTPNHKQSQATTSWGSILFGIAVCGGVLVSQCNRQARQSVQPVATPNVASITDPGTRTLHYWNQLRFTVGSQGQVPSTRAELVVFCNATAARIESIPTAAVDPDAVHVGLLMSSCFRNVSDLDQYEKEPNRFVEAILRGANGDPFGTARDMLQTESAVWARFGELRDECIRTRALLTSRYGIEFPPM